MLSRSTRPPALGPTFGLPGSGTPGQGPVRGRVINFSAVRAPGSGSPSSTLRNTLERAVIADPCSDETSLVRIAGPVPHGGPEHVAKIDRCPPHPKGQVVCAGDAGCICPLSGHITDAERTVMNDVCGQAARLATVLARVLALAALVVLVLLMR